MNKKTHTRFLRPSVFSGIYIWECTLQQCKEVLRRSPKFHESHLYVSCKEVCVFTNILFLNLNLNNILELKKYFFYCKCVKRRRRRTCKILFKSICECFSLYFLGFSTNMAASIKRDLLSSTYKLITLRKQKHNDDYVKVIIHYNKCSYIYYIPFQTVYNHFEIF